MSDDSIPRFTLLSGEGSGALFGMAGGDIAGGSALYSAPTQQATVVAYHLMRNGGIDASTIGSDLADLAGGEQETSVYREPTADFKEWIATGLATAQSTSQPAPWAVPIGIWWRREPERLLAETLALTGLFTTDAPSLLSSLAVAAAAAASCYAQSGSDLVMATAEMLEAGVAAMHPSRSRQLDAAEIPARLRSAAVLVGESPTAIAEWFPPKGENLALGAILLSAPVVTDSYRLVEAGAIYGSSLAGCITGALVAARVGWQPWPWVVPNDTWFIEIGRRLSGSVDNHDDLPQPYDVEERLTLGETEAI